VSDELRIFTHDENDPGSIGGNYIQDLAVDKKGSLWIATTTGLDFYNQSKEVFEHFTQQDSIEEGLSASDIATLWFDTEELLWLGTYGRGVNVLDPNQHRFEHILTKNEVAHLGKNNTIHGIAKDKNHNLWLASFGAGLIKYDLLSGKISQPIKYSDEELAGHTYSLYVDLENRLWVGSYEHLTIVDPVAEIEYETRIVIDGILSEKLERVNQIHQDYLGDIYISSNSGLFKVSETELQQQVMTVYLEDITHKLPNSYTNYNQGVMTVVDDKEGNYWIGGVAGLVYYEVGKNTWTHLVHEADNPQSLTNDSVQVIYEDSHGFIWIGTADGLNRVVRSGADPDTFYFERITTYEGLPNNAVYGILEDQKGKLWISTNLGIVKYGNDVINTDAFRRADGLSSDEFNTCSFYSDSDGRLYFGSINGVTIINEVDTQKQFRESNLRFTHIRVGERDLDMYQINHHKEPSIIQNNNEAAIDLAVANINYSKLGTQRYRYRIRGVDEKWNYLGTRRNMFIAGLPEGKYQLEIQSQLASLPWSSKSKSLDILVKTDFWSSSQAYYLIGFFLVVVFAIILFFLVRYYNLKIYKNVKRAKLESLRVKELRVDNESLKDELADKETNIRNLSRRVEIGARKLDVEKYRDVATGFYRINYLYSLESEDFLDEKVTSSKGFSCYKTIAVLELNDYSCIYKKLGPLAIAEFSSQVSVLIRQKSNAGVQIFQVQAGLFLILGCEILYQDFEDNLLNLKHQIMRSEFGVSNGISEKTNVSLTLFNLSKIAIKTKRHLDVTIDLLIQLHQQLNTSDDPLSYRITKNKLISPKALNSNYWRMETLLEQKIIDIQSI